MHSSGSAKFLKRLNPQQIQKRITMCSAASSSDFDGSISLETPLEDYQRLINDKVESESLDCQELTDNYKRIASVARDTVWKLLFESECKTKEQQTKVAEFLSKVKEDASFHDPCMYNDWIPAVRDELLKRQMLEFWRSHMVERELGPCWARDSDYFDDMEDSAPAAFYNFAGCVAPFGQVTGERRNSDVLEIPPSTTLETSSDVTSDFEANISLATPLQDYENLMKEKVESEELVEDEAINDNFKKISTVARDVIWKLLFSQDAASEEDKTKAAELLFRLKADACFYDPWSYNKWIGSVRDELLKRGMLDFWRTHIVSKELGPCWARDCDFFDDMDDTEPAEFYKQAGCVAAFEKKENE